MKTEIRYTKEYLLLIKEVYGFKVGDWNYEEDNTIPIYQFDYNIDEYPGNKIIAYYPLTKEAKELDLPLLPVTPINKWGVHETHCCSSHGCKYGDNDCCVELGIAKQRYPCEFCNDEEQEFSLEDMKKAIEMVQNNIEDNCKSFNEYISGNIEKEDIIPLMSVEEIIQSLSTQQLPVSFEPEYRYYYHSSKEFYSDAGFIECSKGQYESIKVEIPTCPLKTELKTITNSEGKEVLQGEWIY